MSGKNIAIAVAVIVTVAVASNTMSLLDFVSTAALVATQFFFLSPWKDMAQVRANQDCGNVQVFNFVSMFNNCSLWMLYAYLKGLYFPQMICNIIGTAFALYYIATYYTYATNIQRADATKKMGISFCIVGASCAYPMIMGATPEVVANLGNECIFFNVIMYGAPLAAIGKILQTKSTATLPFLMCVMNEVCSFLWFTVGVLVNDMPTMAPNAIGMALALGQLSLFAIYDNPSNTYGTAAPLSDAVKVASLPRRYAAPFTVVFLLCSYISVQSGMVSFAGAGGSPNKALFHKIYELSRSRNMKPDLKIAIGWNTNIDLIAPALKVFDKMGAKPGTSPKDADRITSQSMLLNCFQQFFQDSGAAERVVTDAPTFDAVVKAIDALPEKKVYTGGNAALMGDRMAREGASVLLGGPMGPQLKELLQEAGPTLKLQDSKGAKEDAHVILEYAVGDSWGGSTSTRNNRFILNRGQDEKISSLWGMEDHLAAVKTFKPHLLVASGINILGGSDQVDGEPNHSSENTITKRLTEVGKALSDVDSEIPIHLELASMASDDFIREVVQKLFTAADSIGCNERELNDIYRAMGGDYSGDGIDKDDLVGKIVKNVPNVQMVTKALKHVLNKSPQGARRLSRIAYHCLPFHIVAERISAIKQFASPGPALARGSIVGTTRACDMKWSDMEESDLKWLAPKHFTPVAGGPRLTLGVDNPSPMWEDDGYRFTLVPLMVCANIKKTVGLGDTVSATGLTYSFE